MQLPKSCLSAKIGQMQLYLRTLGITSLDIAQKAGEEATHVHLQKMGKSECSLISGAPTIRLDGGLQR